MEQTLLHVWKRRRRGKWRVAVDLEICFRLLDLPGSGTPNMDKFAYTCTAEKWRYNLGTIDSDSKGTRRRNAGRKGFMILKLMKISSHVTAR